MGKGKGSSGSQHGGGKSGGRHGSGGKPSGNPNFPSTTGNRSGAAEATIPRRNRELGYLLAAARDAGAHGNLIFDPQIAALCRERGIDTILTNDRGFDRFESLRIQRLDR